MIPIFCVFMVLIYLLTISIIEENETDDNKNT